MNVIQWNALLGVVTQYLLFNNKQILQRLEEHTGQCLNMVHKQELLNSHF